MAWLKKVFGGETEDNSQRGKLERLVLTYLEGARYLATCGKFNEEKCDHLERLLSKHEWYNPKPERIAQIKSNVPKLLITDTGLTGWSHVKVLEHRSLSEAVNTFLKTLWEDFRDDRTREFTKKVVSEMEEVSKLIANTKEQ